ncbi:MogA/MoaB family molybdenum cofactor biosynthesis protein [Thermosulfurimonas marina]|uniref:Molybdenum cofactor biosynthesis protein B n=1 Tax=Thermosulfurimonas marina TaxID=2047767 RepID=A0A6H1WQW6_9BACT|nr:MogA/MoaB family molybdenum cofactor biosynthesis protein [Thermosulfurimonas marina]QJA05550.1 MogA/MoaB family molybdenum cofactor biosynthesis protein [Thermosulfurimonas marina]
MKAGVLTVSDKGARGEREDLSGKILMEKLSEAGFEVAAYEIVPDEYEEIVALLVDWADRLQLPLILTTGGTGLSPRDVTPEATRAVLEKEIPGIAETLRAKGLEHTPYSMLSRGLAGIRRKSLIINLPGSPRAVEEAWEVLSPVLRHAIEKIQGSEAECARG